MNIQITNGKALEELRKEFDKMLKSEVERVSNVINPSPTLNDRVFDWFYSKLQERDLQINTLKDEVNDLEHDIAIKFEEIAAQKQLTKDEIKRVSDIYQSVIDELKKKYELP